MALLPNLDQAVVAPEKITGYLLSPTHHIGGPKCAYFMSFGYSPAEPEILMAALIDHAGSWEATALPPSRHGTKFIISGPLTAPDGRLCYIRAVWIIDAGATAPRFVTAVPARGVP